MRKSKPRSSSDSQVNSTVKKAARSRKAIPASGKSSASGAQEVERVLVLVLTNAFDVKREDVRLLAKKIADKDDMSDLTDPVILDAIAELIRRWEDIQHYAEAAHHLMHAREIYKWIVEHIKKPVQSGKVSFDSAEARDAFRAECLRLIRKEERELRALFRDRKLTPAQYERGVLGHEISRKFVERAIP